MWFDAGHVSEPYLRVLEAIGACAFFCVSVGG
jgi:hypothetical protein